MTAIDADFSKTYLFPPAFEDLIPKDHPARFIREFVDYARLDVELEWNFEHGDGRPTYASALLLRVWIYGYMHRITTVRKLEAACRENVGLLWLTGMNAPDHNTLWRFWRLNRKTVKRIFKQGLNLAVDAGMLGMVLHAIDGTKLQSRYSTRTAWSQKQLEKFRLRLDQEIEALEAEIATHEESNDEGYRLREELTTQENLREIIAERLSVLRKHGQTMMNRNEPEARVMKLAAGGTRLGYNAQIVADAEHGLIVAEAVSNAPYDQGQMMPMMDLVEEEFGTLASETVADGGYNTVETLVQAEDQGRSITLATGANDPEAHAHEPFHATHFKYDATENVYICPQKQRLEYSGQKKKDTGRSVEIYRCAVSATCPVASECTESPKGRSIERSEHQDLVRQHRDKRESVEGKANLKKRSELAERPFADIKWHMGFVRFRGGGLLNAAAEWTWNCLTFNLRILLRRWRAEMTFQAAN
ncbi:MAG: IS1182 family transposase [Gemmatimonadaceae bacterium]|nr:IS1182 family transposase [Gemmatimonadaceae bacterium]